MRLIPLVALLAVLAVVPRQTTMAIAATAAATLLEATPFVLAAWLVARIVPGASGWVGLLGCGCGGGPAALSLPAAAATWLALGPWVAIARFGAALAWRFVGPSPPCHPELAQGRQTETPIATLHSLLPFALVAGVVSHVVPVVFSAANVSPAIASLVGGLLGIALAPCGLGVVGIASALHGVAPWASSGFLCTAGILDLRAMLHHHQPHIAADATAYGTVALACAIVALHGGASLVHPRFVVPLIACATACAGLAWHHRRESGTRARWAPALILIVAIAGAPPPTYTATATTLGDAFPGERLTFTGVLARDARRTSLVRYAITCCRADAAPIAVLLTTIPPARTGSWLTASGRLVVVGGSLGLQIDHARQVSPPTDPFLYR